MKNLNADVVVVGGGAAGMPAAAAAAEKGVNVILLEKRHILGGNAVLAGDRPKGVVYPMESEEKRLQRCQALENNQDEYFKNQMNYTHWNTNPKLVRALLNRSGDTIRWLGNKGVIFDEAFAKRLIGTAKVTGPIVGGVGVKIINILTENCKRMNVQIILNAQARKLQTNKKGEVTGVLVDTKDESLNITTKSVILATGGFAGNKKLLEKYFPNYNDAYIRLGGLPHQGDGLLMATGIGATTCGTVTLEMEGPDFPWASLHYLPLFNLVKHPTTVWVNSHGERYTEENSNAFEKSHSIYAQPGRVTYILFDDNIKKRILMEQNLASTIPISIKKFDQELRQHKDKGRIMISESWDEIADWMGVDPNTFKATLNEYQYFCDQGYDGLFLKNPKFLLPLNVPPYYAIKCYIKLLVTHGDIKVNQHLEVLGKQDTPILGLYAAGVDIGGTDSDTYNAPGLPGHSHGFSLISGRIAGEHAAEYSKTRSMI